MTLPEPLDTSPCAACRTAACCHRLRVVVTASDVHRLYRGARASPLDVTFLLPAPEGNLRLAAGGPLHELCLQKRKGGALGDPCALLGGGAPFRCTVHPDRPMVCRSFPLRPAAPPGNALCEPAWDAEHARDVALFHGLWRIERDLDARFAAGWNRVADATPPGRARTPNMLFYWLVDVFDHVTTALAPHLADPASQRALVAGWGAKGPWTPALDAAFARLDVALRGPTP